MTMQENDTSGVSLVRPSVLDEPRGRTRVLCLVAVAVSSVTMNVVFAFYFARGGGR